MIRAIDIFCGGGGSSWGAQSAGAEIVAGFDICPKAGAVFQDNFPKAMFYLGDLCDLKMVNFSKEIGHIDLLLASPECTNHTHARGNRPRCSRSQDLALQVLRFASAFRPRWIVIENVRGFRDWSNHQVFMIHLKNNLGYRVKELILNSALYGVPQSRNRYYLICESGKKPKVDTSRCEVTSTAKDIIEFNKYPFTPLFKPGRAERTLRSAKSAIKELGPKKPFLIVYYGSDFKGWQRVDRPLRTITTINHFGLVVPTATSHKIRMLQPPELARGMGLPRNFKIESAGSKKDQNRVIGNMVTPPVMTSIIRTLTGGNNG